MDFEKIKQLPARPAFTKDEDLTAGNASSIGDGGKRARHDMGSAVAVVDALKKY